MRVWWVVVGVSLIGCDGAAAEGRAADAQPCAGEIGEGWGGCGKWRTNSRIIIFNFTIGGWAIWP